MTSAQTLTTTDCCIVGGGPAGVMLALLLARQGIAVTLLEAQPDFDRDFRGNTLSPAALAILRELKLDDGLLQLRHARIPRFSVETADGSVTFADFTRLQTHYPFIMMLPQSAFLTFLTEEAQRYPHFQLILGARVRSLLTDGSIVRGVRYDGPAGPGEVQARLTVGADGRFSKVRKLAGLQPIATTSPIDVLWFRVPRAPDDPSESEAAFRFGHGALLALMDHGDEWQIGYIIAKGSYPTLRARGFDAFRRSVAELAPELADRLEHLSDWRQCSLLAVESSRVRRWYREGLLLIGDAAHVMSPVGGVGINCAIQDAAAAASVLAEPLVNGALTVAHLREVQRRRVGPTRLIQACQHFAHRQVVDGALASDRPFRIPSLIRLCLRIPILRDVPARLIAFGRL